MTNALFVSGGVKKIGSLRNIELKRNGQLVSVLDLYDLLLHGDTSGDRQLRPGDVIFIPPIGATQTIYGAVRRPAIYEVKKEKTAGDLVELAGGLLPDADGRLAQLERIEASRLRDMHNIDLESSAGRNTELMNGDKLRVPTIRPTLERIPGAVQARLPSGRISIQSGLAAFRHFGQFRRIASDRGSPLDRIEFAAKSSSD